MKIPKGFRACPALGGPIRSPDCGAQRNSALACPPTCAFNPFAPGGYDQWLRLDATWMPKATGWVVHCIGEEGFRETMENFSPDDDEGRIDLDLALPAAVHWLLTGFHPDDGVTLGRRWEEAGWPGLNNDERVMSQYRSRSFATLLEIQQIVDHQSLMAVDLWAGRGAQPFLMLDRVAATTFQPFDLVLSWITPYPHFTRFVGSAIVLPRDLQKAFEGEWRTFAKDYLGLKRKATPRQLKEALGPELATARDLIRDLREEAHQQMLRGSDLAVCRMYFRPAGNRNAVLDALRSLPEFELDETPSADDLPDSETFVWLRRGESKRIEAQMPEQFRHPDDESAGVGVLGRISVGQREVMVQTMGRQKGEFARTRVTEIFGPLLRFERDSAVDLGVQMAERLERQGSLGDGPTGAARPPIAAPRLAPEDKADLLRSVMERHFQGMADAKMPLFGGRSPREAAGDPAIRPEVISWVKGLWHSTVELGRRDGVPLEEFPRALARELGLQELAGF
jgi:hypothetical protein